jgi:SAM-dependent methyltransferase
MVNDPLFLDPRLAELYDLHEPWERRPEFPFYMARVMSAECVLDVGCGTGELLRLARQAGHTGRLCGIDPAEAMLEQARRRPDIEWVLGEAASGAWDQEFDLVVMTGHAIQVIMEDDAIRRSLAAIRSALTEQGRFVFETRNPLVRAWESWMPDHVRQFLDPDGAVVRKWHEIETVDGEVVSYTTTFTSSRWDRPHILRSRQRFLDADSLSAFLSGADLAIEEQFGDWDRQPLTDTSPEIITIARRG